MAERKEPEEEVGNNLEGYSAAAMELLRGSDARRGSRLRIRTQDGFEATGLLIPRYEGGSGDNIVLKLKSGYNIGIDAGTISSLTVLEPPIVEKSAVDTAGERMAEGQATQRKTVLILSTGGTIASRVDYRTGAVKPALTAADLYSTVPELGKIASIKPEVVFSTFSENLVPQHWQKLSERIVALGSSDSTFDGIVLMLGTDTMAYVSAALSFSLMGVKFPVVCVGAQRSSDRPSSDSVLNLQAATHFAAESKAAGVFVAMHKSENDDTIAIHSGVRVRKNHTSRRDAFQSIDAPLFAEVSREEEISRAFDHGRGPNRSIPQELKMKTNFDTHVSLIKFHPAFDPSILDYLVRERGVKGIIVEGTGLGHVSSQTVQKIREIVKERGIFVGITSQCIWGHVDLNVYATGIDLIAAGAVPLENMLSETALAKLSWALGNFGNERVASLMKQDILGEITERIPLKG